MSKQIKKRVLFGNSPVALIGRLHPHGRAQKIEVLFRDSDVIYEIRRQPNEKSWSLVLIVAGDSSGPDTKGTELGSGTLSEMKNLVMKEALLKIPA